MYCVYHEQIHVPNSFCLLRFLKFRLAIIVDGVPQRDTFLSLRFFRGGGIIYDCCNTYVVVVVVTLVL